MFSCSIATVLPLVLDKIRLSIRAPPLQRPSLDRRCADYGTRFTGGGVQEPSRIDGGVPVGE